MNQDERHMQLALEEAYHTLQSAHDTSYLGLSNKHIRQLNLCLEGLSSILDDYENDPDNPDAVPGEETDSAQV